MRSIIFIFLLSVSWITLAEDQVPPSVPQNGDVEKSKPSLHPLKNKKKLRDHKKQNTPSEENLALKAEKKRHGADKKLSDAQAKDKTKPEAKEKSIEEQIKEVDGESDVQKD